MCVCVCACVCRFDLDNSTSTLVDNLHITSTWDGEDDGIGLYVLAGAGMLLTASILLFMPAMPSPMDDTARPVPFCCAGKKTDRVRELADPLLGSDSEDDGHSDGAPAA